MREVTISAKRSCWYLFVDNEFAGRYTSKQEVDEVAELARASECWPPKPPCEGIRWRDGRWRATV